MRILDWLRGEVSGLKKLVPDIRDLHIGELILGVYTKKYDQHILKPIFIENQFGLNVCSFEAWANALAVYFGQPVSVRWLVAKAWQQGLCQRTGYAELRSGAKVAQKWGIVFEKDCPSDESLSWEEFVKVDFTKLDPIAKDHRIGSYYFVDNESDYYKAIDNGYAVVLGRYWTGKFDEGWVLNPDRKASSAHATLGVGYKDKLTIEANSYGTTWGDKGLFRTPMSQLQKDIDTFGAIAVTPVPYTPKDIIIRGLWDQVKELQNMIKSNLARNRFYETALKLYREGAILSPDNIMLGCGYAVTAVWNKAFPDDKVYHTGTSSWWDWLKSSNKFEAVFEAEPDCIIISPTPAIPPQSPLKNGHIGVVGRNKAPDGSYWIMSNNSLTGKWDAHWTVKSWNAYYQDHGKIKTNYYKLK